MVRLLQKLLEEGLMDGQGLLKEPYFTKGVRIGDVLVTKESVRAVQLAKGAIAAGIEILADSYGIRFSDISKVVLAGTGRLHGDRRQYGTERCSHGGQSDPYSRWKANGGRNIARWWG
mgnify:CR=1 FL=1